MPEQRPVLYSFRRCPYALRARLALAAAGLEPGRDLELREVSLRAKPPELLAASAKGTVPVLVVFPEGAGDGPAPALVLDESLAIIHWALERRDPEGWLAGWSAADQATIAELIAENDGGFKQHLDRFKYPERFQKVGCSVSSAVSGSGGAAARSSLRSSVSSSVSCSAGSSATSSVSSRDAEASRMDHRREGLAILLGWSARLAAGGWLLGSRPCLADWALLPFVRQFRLADPAGFDAEPALEPLQRWLARFLAGGELAAVLAPPWAERSPWRSPGWLYHLALRPEWQQARPGGEYRRSTRGRSLEEVGFIHLSAAHQVAATATRFYADLPAGELLLLTVDPRRLAAAGLAVRWEPAPGCGELFPHLFGPLPLQAVLLAEPLLPASAGRQNPH